MREIKFRAWQDAKPRNDGYDNLRIKEPRMRYDIQKGCDVEGCKCSDKLQDWLDKPHNTVMQYTGLKDKNGVEIYEGDIVKKKSLSKSLVLGVVEYNDTRACFEVRVPGGHDLIGYGTIREVIGNIYENPELLEGLS